MVARPAENRFTLFLAALLRKRCHPLFAKIFRDEEPWMREYCAAKYLSETIGHYGI
jgi:hypothetical protein